MLIDRVKWALKESFRAGARLCPTGTSQDYRTMELEVDKILLGLGDELTKRVPSLLPVVEDLLEQHERQIDMEACALWQSYPDKFPEWDRAWENAAKALFEGGG